MRFTNIRRTKIIEVIDYGQVGAGKTLEFLPRTKKKIYWTGEDFSVKGISVVTVNGNSLIDVGINSGDELTIQTKFLKEDVKNGKLVIAELPCTGKVVKFFYRFENKIILRSANEKYDDLIYDEDLITILAIVLKSSKEW